MQHSEQSGVSAGHSGRLDRRLRAGAWWVVLLLWGALSLTPQLGCGSAQSADGAGGQSGDEGRR